MYCYVVKWPVFSLQRGSAKWAIAPSNFSSLWIILDPPKIGHHLWAIPYSKFNNKFVIWCAVEMTWSWPLVSFHQQRFILFAISDIFIVSRGCAASVGRGLTCITTGPSTANGTASGLATPNLLLMRFKGRLRPSNTWANRRITVCIRGRFFPTIFWRSSTAFVRGQVIVRSRYWG